MRKVVIIGGGPVGALTAIYLAKRGVGCSLYERRSDPRLTPVEDERSINLALSRRGFDALEPVGLFEEMVEIAVPMRGRLIHSTDGSTLFQPYGRGENDALYALSRSELNAALLREASRQPEVEIYFEERCSGVNLKDCAASFELPDGGTNVVEADTFLGCDGAASELRRSMQIEGRCAVEQRFSDYGYKQLLIPAGRGGTPRLDANALHIWPRGGYMLIAHPNRDGSSTGTLFYPLEGAESFAALRSRRDIRRFFEKQFPDAAALIPDLEAQFFGAPTGALSEIACDPWHFQDRALLLGDSAHGIPPFLGQGLNSAFESVALLMDCFHRFAGDWEEAFRTFQRIRKPDTDAAAKLAQDNFVEMRDRIADPRFLFRKQVELELERRFFPRFISRFGMIQFSRTSYARARDFGDVNDGILDELTADAACLDDIRWREAKRMIEERL